MISDLVIHLMCLLFDNIIFKNMVRYFHLHKNTIKTVKHQHQTKIKGKNEISVPTNSSAVYQKVFSYLKPRPQKTTWLLDLGRRVSIVKNYLSCLLFTFFSYSSFLLILHYIYTFFLIFFALYIHIMYKQKK